jgi:transcriptional regulator of acetoin/glycerol metabolism
MTLALRNITIFTGIYPTYRYNLQRFGRHAMHFLEIGDLPLLLQVKLLTFLDERTR